MSDWDRIDPPTTAFGWSVELNVLLGAIAVELPAMAARQGMQSAVWEGVRRIEAGRREATAEIERLKAELDEVHAANDRLGGILRRTAVALKGPEPETGLHSWHDLPELAAQMKAELADSREHRLGWAAEVGKLAAQRAELRELLGFARTAIQNGFMDGQWATIVQTQKELLPSVAVMEAKHAEVVINAIEKALRPKEKA